MQNQKETKKLSAVWYILKSVTSSIWLCLMITSHNANLGHLSHLHLFHKCWDNESGLMVECILYISLCWWSESNCLTWYVTLILIFLKIVLQKGFIQSHPLYIAWPPSVQFGGQCTFRKMRVFYKHSLMTVTAVAVCEWIERGYL